MSKPPALLERASPQDGDVVVTREAHSRPRYTVRRLPGLPQLGLAGHDHAVQLARSFGRTHGMDVWYREDDAYLLVEANRPRTSQQPFTPQAVCGPAKA